MTLRQLRIFALLANRLNLRVAAEELGIAEPSVSEQLKLLEEELGTRLHLKIGRGIALTPPGRLVLREITVALSRIDNLKAKLSGAAARTARMTLTVGGSYSPSVSLLPSLLAVYRKTHPLVDTNLRTAGRAAIERMVRNSEVDIALINNAPATRALSIEPYRQEQCIAFAVKNHPLTRKRKLTWQDLERVPFIIRRSLRKSGTAESLIQDLRRRGLKLTVAMHADSPEAVKAFVKSKMGVGILFKETIESELRTGEFKMIKLPEQKAAGQSFIVYRKDRPLSTTASEFLELLRQHKPKESQQRKIG